VLTDTDPRTGAAHGRWRRLPPFGPVRRRDPYRRKPTPERRTLTSRVRASARNRRGRRWSSPPEHKSETRGPVRAARPGDQQESEQPERPPQEDQARAAGPEALEDLGRGSSQDVRVLEALSRVDDLGAIRGQGRCGSLGIVPTGGELDRIRAVGAHHEDLRHLERCGGLGAGTSHSGAGATVRVPSFVVPVTDVVPRSEPRPRSGRSPRPHQQGEGDEPRHQAGRLPAAAVLGCIGRS
jgi:hypothetical protein